MDNIDNISLNFHEENLAWINGILALVMFAVALEIRLKDFGEVLRQPKMILTGVLSQFLLLPILTLLLVNIFSMPASFALGLVLVSVCPGGNISNFFTLMAKGNLALSVCLTSIATLAAGFFIPFTFYFWAGLSPQAASLLNSVEVDTGRMLLLAFLLLGLPLTSGMLLAHFLPKIAEKIAKPLRKFSVFIFLALIVGAFLANWGMFLDLFHYFFWIVLLHNGLAWFCGYNFARIMGLAIKERQTIAIETAIQNSGLGLVLVFNFFPHLGGMMMVIAWWGIWHMVAGLTMGYWFGRSRGEVVSGV